MKVIQVYHLKNILKICFFFLTLCFLLFFSKENFHSVKTSVTIFLNSIIPSLFPFIFFTEIILKTNLVHLLTKLFGNLITKIFKVNKEAVSSVIIGFLCGFPMGAKTVSTLYQDNKITKKDAHILLSFVNNCNPAFILSTIGLGIFGNIQIGWILLISHVTSAILVGIMSSIKYHQQTNNIIHKNGINCKKNKKIITSTQKNTSNSFIHPIDFFAIIKTSITNTFITLGNVLGFMVLFNLLANLMTVLLQKFLIPNEILAFLSGIFEITNGCNQVYSLSIPTNIKVCTISFLLGFSGFCILCQIFSTIHEQNFKFSHLIKSKLLQGILSFILTYLILKISHFDVTTQNVFQSMEKANAEFSYYINNMVFAYLASTFAIFIILFIYYTFVNKHNRVAKKKGRKATILKKGV